MKCAYCEANTSRTINIFSESNGWVDKIAICPSCEAEYRGSQ